MSEALAALREVDFNWTTRINHIWDDSLFDIPELHSEFRKQFAEKLEALISRPNGSKNSSESPLGWAMSGPAGIGKTHLLGAMRKMAADRGAAFVLVDMTDVRDFWETLLQGYIDSLQVPYPKKEFQYLFLLRNFVQGLSSGTPSDTVLNFFTNRKSVDLAGDVKKVLDELHRRYPRALGYRYQDVVRALICLNSKDSSIANAGMSWLQGLAIEEQIGKELAFGKSQEKPQAIIKALSWLISLTAPTVVVFDQLDPIVHQFSRFGVSAQPSESDEQGTAKNIVEQIGAGLAGMYDTTFRTLPVVASIELTWQRLGVSALNSFKDRFEEPFRLQSPKDPSAVFKRLVEARLQVGYQAKNFIPPYPTWPFKPEAFENPNFSARELLKLCESHRRICLQNASVIELAKFEAKDSVPPQPVDQFESLDRRFADLQTQAGLNELLDEKNEDDKLAPLFQTAMECLIHEHAPRLPKQVDAEVDVNFSGGKSTRPLHARLRLIFTNENGREEHFCVRAIQRQHHSAFTTRLKAAMTQSGIDRSLSFRHLTIIRSVELPGGKTSKDQVKKFENANGKLYQPSEKELRILFALNHLHNAKEIDLIPWLQKRKPVTGLALRKVLVPSTLFDEEPSSVVDLAPATNRPDPLPSVQTANTNSKPVGLPIDPLPRPVVSSHLLPIGNRLLGSDKLGEVLSIPVHLLSKHTLVLGGSGSGKSVTVRRLVEESALLGIPSIIIDAARDMSFFDTPWPKDTVRRNGDLAQAERFHASTELIVWTPGRESGNPLNFQPLPAFGPLLDSPEELEEAIQMAAGSLTGIVAPGRSQKSANKKGTLVASLRYFAKQYPDGTLDDFIDLLSSLPPDAGTGVNKEGQMAMEMADSLRSERSTNPLLKTTGTIFDPAVLFGDANPTDMTRISSISLLGLPSDAMQRSLVNQLAMLLFTWIKKNPTPPNGRPIRGLVVIDEAKDFLPSKGVTECKESMMRLAAQARKYRLGLIFATQHPKDIENKIVGNCATHLYGLNNSPASLATLGELMAQRGSTANDFGRLKRGQFYVHNADAGHGPPTKIQIPLSLSLSPDVPLEESQILAKARESRARIGV